MCGVHARTDTPSATEARAMSSETPRSTAPSSIPGKMWQCRSIMRPHVTRSLISYFATPTGIRPTRTLSQLFLTTNCVFLVKMWRSQSHRDALMQFCHTALKNSVFGQEPLICIRALCSKSTEQQEGDQHENAPIFSSSVACCLQYTINWSSRGPNCGRLSD